MVIARNHAVLIAAFLLGVPAHAEEAGPPVLSARVIAAGLPGAAAVSPVGYFHPGGPGSRHRGFDRQSGPISKDRAGVEDQAPEMSRLDSLGREQPRVSGVACLSRAPAAVGRAPGEDPHGAHRTGGSAPRARSAQGRTSRTTGGRFAFRA